MKRISTLIFMFLLSSALMAQERYIKLYSGGVEVYSTTTSGSNSMTFPDGNIVFTHNSTSNTFTLAAIDSMVFVQTTTQDDDTTGSDPVEVDTGTAVRITWNGSEVDIVNPFSAQGITVSAEGGVVNVVSTIDSDYVSYILSGSSTAGSLTITTEKKVMLVLNSLSLTSSAGPAIWVASDHKAIIDLGGTSSLTDGPSAAGKGALQSAGKIAFQGEGTLNVTGTVKHGIQSAGSTTVNGGTINVLGAVKDGMNVDNFIMNDGTVTVTNPNGDGIDGDQGYIQINGGTLDITVSADGAKCLKCDSNMVFTGGSTTLHANGTLVIENYDPSYCTAAKTGGNLRFLGGTLTATCASGNAGGKAVSVDGDVIISGGVLNLTAQGACAKYNNSASTYDSYASACLKAGGDITVSGGTISANAGGRAITTDGNYTQTGGSITATTSKDGFTVTGTGTSCTDGFAAACLKADGNIAITGGSFNGTSTGKGGRGIVANGTLTVGLPGANDSLVNIYVTTSGAPVNVSSGGGLPGGGGEGDYWKGLAKGIKIEGNITINSGHVQSYCSQTSGSTTAEAIESKDSLFVHGGTVEANAYDDAINAASFIRITGGQVWAYARGNDGLDCNGNRIEVSGGTLICRGSEVAIDDNGDHGGKIYVTGGTIILVGGNMGTTEATPQVTGQKSVKITSNTSTLLTNGFAIKNETSGNVVVTFKWGSFSGSGFESYSTSPQYNTPKPPPSGGGSGIYITSPDLQAGSTYKYYASPSINGGTSWHGLYDGATVTTSGNGTSLTLQ